MSEPAIILPLTPDAIALLVPIAEGLGRLDKMPVPMAQRSVGAAFENAIASMMNAGLVDDLETIANGARGKDIICTVGENLGTAKAWALRAVLKVQPAKRDALGAFLDAKIMRLRQRWPEVRRILEAPENEAAPEATPKPPDDDPQAAQVPA